MTDTYRGWSISFDYGNYYAFGPNYDASWEGEEDGYVGNGESTCARTRDAVIAEIDEWFDEQSTREGGLAKAPASNQ